MLGSAAGTGCYASPPVAPRDGQEARVSIASFGPHGSLTQVIDGFKAAMKDKGFEDGKNISYEYSDCNFDPVA